MKEWFQIVRMVGRMGCGWWAVMLVAAGSGFDPWGITDKPTAAFLAASEGFILVAFVSLWEELHQLRQKQGERRYGSI